MRLLTSQGWILTLVNVERNDFQKVFRAKTPRRKEKNILYFSELGVLSVFARVSLFPSPQSTENFKYLWIDSAPLARVQRVDESALIQLSDKTQIDKILGFNGPCLGILLSQGC
jgi:hypothetical protein